MIRVRPAAERGRTRFDWLDSRHTFSFGDYHDRAHMGFRTLRVINDDTVEPGTGFGLHGHRDMEILTWILEGALEHQDSTGASGVIRPGDIQRMSAGTGIRHSESNASGTGRVHFLQIWVLPEKTGLRPGYEQMAIPEEERRNRLRILASRDGRAGSVTLHQDAAVYAALLDPGRPVEHAFAAGRAAWIHVARGAVLLDGRRLEAGDGAAIEDERAITIEGAAAPGEVLVFDLA